VAIRADLGRALIVTARKQAGLNVRKPRQADLRRAISSAYYAVFHALAKECADRLVGTASNRRDAAWQQVYRALEHGFARHSGESAQKLGFPSAIVNFADTFGELQRERHAADYDPSMVCTLADARSAIDRADAAIGDLRGAPRADRTAFATLVLLKQRKV